MESCVTSTSASWRRPISRTMPVPAATGASRYCGCAALKDVANVSSNPESSTEVVVARMTRWRSFAQPRHTKKHSSANRRSCALRNDRVILVIFDRIRTLLNRAIGRFVRDAPLGCFLHAVRTELLGLQVLDQMLRRV